MKSRLDQTLGAVGAPAVDHDLDRLESDVFLRIAAKRREASAGAGLTVQLAAALLALAIGVVVGEVRERRPADTPGRSEMIVLSDGANLAPSVRLGGGA